MKFGVVVCYNLLRCSAQKWRRQYLLHICPNIGLRVESMVVVVESVRAIILHREIGFSWD